MSLRLATSSSFASSSTPATTPVTPHANASSSFHVFRATASPPPILVGDGTYTISRRVSEAPSTPKPPSSSVSVADAGNTRDGSVTHAVNGGGAGTDKYQLPVTVNVEAMAEEARRRARQKGRKEEEVEAMAQTALRFATRLAADHKAVLQPDVETPFMDAQDVVNRLLPYHVFLPPKDDLRPLIDPCPSTLHTRKGKRKATEEDLLREEIAETKLALECWRRKGALEKRFRRAKISSGKRLASDDQEYVLAHAVLDSERADMASLQAEYRNYKSILDRIERERKAAATPSQSHTSPPARASYYPSTSTTASNASTRAPSPSPGTQASSSQAQTQTSSTYRAQYKPYSYTYQPSFQPYSYSQQYTSNTASPAPTAQAGSSAGAGNTSSPSLPTGSLNAPIPVQIPVTSLTTLSALGIVPIPAENAPPPGQPQPAAVLRGTTQNGTVANLDINISALGAAQASGLAVLLSGARALSANGNGSSGTTSLPTPVSSVASSIPVASRTHSNGNGVGQEGRANNT